MAYPEIHPNTQYNYFKLGPKNKMWVKVLQDQPNPLLVRCQNMQGETVEFSISEFRQWLSEDIVRPACGICGESVWRLDVHLKTHQMNVHG